VMLKPENDTTDRPVVLSAYSGTAMAADFCRIHCPGGCNRPEDHK
jgi:hypothetical protein